MLKPPLVEAFGGPDAKEDCLQKASRNHVCTPGVNQPEQDPDAGASATAGEPAGRQPEEHPNGPVQLDETTAVRIRGAIAELLPSVLFL